LGQFYPLLEGKAFGPLGGLDSRFPKPGNQLLPRELFFAAAEFFQEIIDQLFPWLGKAGLYDFKERG
jgi:hypothetical protein